MKPRPDADAGALALVTALRNGASLGEALASSSPMLARVAVSEAAKRFDGGAVGLFIVDVRDALGFQLSRAGVLSQDVLIRTALEQAARRVDDDTFVQHLINTLLEVTGVYVEAMPVERLHESKCTRALSDLFTRALCLLISRHDGARRLGERTAAMEFAGPVPAPSAPR
ncbi:MAG: hypothetical protein JNM17_30535 [Archangium sp.]|nr:hypothetical protein [Archangium sp.]